MLKKIFAILIFLVLLGGGFYLYQSSPSNVYYAQNLISLNPSQLSDYNNTRLIHVFESLVKYDKNLRIQSSLARSYGKLSPTIWEFTLKDNVYTHDGTFVDAAFLVKQLDRLRSLPSLKMHFKTIQQIKHSSDFTIQLSLTQPDPLILAKLAQVPIIDLDQPLSGTGPYQILGMKGQSLKLQRFDLYHGNLASLDKLNLIYEPDTQKRLKKLNSTATLSVLNILPEQIQRLPQDFNYDSFSDLSSHFFIFNYKTQLGAQKDFQATIFSLLKNIDFAKFTYNQVASTDQFIPKGVFGYDPTATSEFGIQSEFTIPKALQDQEIQIAINSDLATFGEYLKNYFQSSGLKVKIKTLELSQAQTSDLADCPLVFIGFKSDYADSQSFFETLAKTGSRYNFGFYRNLNIQANLQQITQAQTPKDRLAILQKMNQIILNYPALGVPVYENKVYYATKMGYNLSKRLDGVLDFYNLMQD